MSRFFGTASDSDTESEVSEEEIIQRPAVLPTYTFSDDEEEQKRIVRSAKEKRFEELKEIIRQIRNFKKIKDLSNMLSSFEDLMKAYQKALPVITKEENGITPRFYVQCLVEMETFLTEVWEDRDGRKNLSKTNSKSLSNLRQKLRKYIKDFEADIAKFKLNPEMDEEEEEEEEKSDDDESDEEVGPASTRKADDFRKAAPKAKVALADGEESDDSYWDSDEEDETSSSDDDTKYANMKEKFLKVAGGDDDDRKKKEKKDRKDKEKAQRRQQREEEEEAESAEATGGEWKRVKGGVATQAKPKMFAKDADINTEVVLKKLSEILAARGKKGTDRREQVEMLHELSNISEANNLGVGITVKMKYAIIAAIFDYNPKICDAMKAEHWDKLVQCIAELLTILNSRNDIVMGEHILEDFERLDSKEVEENADETLRFYHIGGSMLTVVERMDEEFVKILKECDAHSNEYVERLKDETRVTANIDSLQVYIERQNVPSELCRLYMRKIDHLYYKFDPNTIKVQAESKGEKETSLQVMDRLCRYIYVNDSDRLKPRAMLCHIYHYALHDDWYKARDLMLMSKLQETVHLLDPSTQILYNRTMVQLGLCAFRHGHTKEAHHALLDIQSSGRAKELLAQGLLLQRQHERTSEQEKIEKQRQMPFHMHINLELLECVYLVSAMLIEIPYMAAHEADARRRMISKSFHHQLKVSERQAVTGPPESMREHVVAASKAMRNGLWNQAHNYIINEKMNAKVWDLFYQADRVRSMLVRKVQEESLRTYLFTHSSVYDSLSMAILSKMFDLEQSTVHSIISKMVMNEELMVCIA